MPHVRSNLTISYSTAGRSSTQQTLRSHSSNHTLPHNHFRAPARHFRRSFAKSSPLHEDLMQTVDYRYIEQLPRRRSSFALSDIWEQDEMEIEISEILPTSPEYVESIELARRRSRFTRKIAAFVLSLREKWTRRAGVRHATVTNMDNRELDLLA